MKEAKKKEIKLFHHKCVKCGYEWDSEKEHPKACPYCKSYKWEAKEIKK